MPQVSKSVFRWCSESYGSKFVSTQIFLERMKEGHCQSDKHWICFRGSVGGTSERQGGVCLGFSKCIDTILNWTEQHRQLKYIRLHFSYNCWKCYTSTNKTKIIWIETVQFFFILGGSAWCLHVFQHYVASTVSVLKTVQKFYRRCCRGNFGKQTRKDKKHLYSGVTSYGRVWRKGAGTWGLAWRKGWLCYLSKRRIILMMTAQR